MKSSFHEQISQSSYPVQKGQTKDNGHGLGVIETLASSETSSSVSTLTTFKTVLLTQFLTNMACTYDNSRSYPLIFAIPSSATQSSKFFAINLTKQLYTSSSLSWIGTPTLSTSSTLSSLDTPATSINLPPSSTTETQPPISTDPPATTVMPFSPPASSLPAFYGHLRRCPSQGR